MGQTLQKSEVWRLVERQHGVITRQQLLDVGVMPREIEHAIATRRLHPAWRGVYAFGRPQLSREGRWLAAVLACGAGAVLSHGSAAALWGIGEYERGRIEVSVPYESVRRRPGIRTCRRPHLMPEEVTTRSGIPLTIPSLTLVDLAARLSWSRMETAINEAVNRDLVTPDELRRALDERPGRRGIRKLRAILDRRTFRLTRSQLERWFLPLAEAAGLPLPETRVWLNGFEVDFYFRDLGLVVETDSLRYHRTAAQQARDRLRDQAHTAAGLTPLRFTHEQVRYERAYVARILGATVAQLRNN